MLTNIVRCDEGRYYVASFEREIDGHWADIEVEVRGVWHYDDLDDIKLVYPPEGFALEPGEREEVMWEILRHEGFYVPIARRRSDRAIVRGEVATPDGCREREDSEER